MTSELKGNTSLSMSEPLFLYVKIPAAIMPVDRGEDFEEPLDGALQDAGVGEVTGGGSALGDDGGIEYVGIDVEATDLDAAVSIIRKLLREQGAPKGTVIEHDGRSYLV